MQRSTEISIMTKLSHQLTPNATIFVRFWRYLFLLLLYVHIHKTTSDHDGKPIGFGPAFTFAQAQQQPVDRVDPTRYQPSLVLIVPQSFRVPTNPLQNESIKKGADQTRFQQYVAIINNAQNDHEDQIIREQYGKLSLQLRDARTPVTGQLFFETIIDYFPPNSRNYLLIPITLDQVSTFKQNNNDNSPSTSKQPHHSMYSKSLSSLYITEKSELLSERHSSTNHQPQQLIVSIRPCQNDTGFGSDTVELVSSAPILVEQVPSNDGKRSFSIVQTDKPIYKPNELVKIRALIMNENLRPIVGDDFKIQIKNPQKSVVEEIRFPRASNSIHQIKTPDDDSIFLDHVFEFPPEPMPGTWSVHLLHSDPVANDTTSFEVKEYVLPPFEISFESPKHILTSARTIAGALIAKYHYGKPVQGKVQFKFGYKESSASKTNFIARTTIKTIDPITGRSEYNISADKSKVVRWFPQTAGIRLVVEATVTEMTTGHRETAQDISCTFVKNPYMISFEDSIEDFKPGLTQQLAVRLVETLSSHPGPGGVKLIAQYQDQNETRLDAAERAAESMAVGFRELLDTVAVTDSQGQAVFNIGPLRDDIRSIVVTVRMLNSNDTHAFSDQLNSTAPGKNDLAYGQHTLFKHDSQNGWISLINKSVTHLKVGESFVSDLLIRDAVVVPQRIFYAIMSKGQIMAMDNLDPFGLVNFNITEAMVPSIRLVLFALTHDSVGLLSDSMRINVDQSLNCGLQMQYESKSGRQPNSAGTAKPNEEGTIKISARRGDVVSLIGVDNAVYSLNNRTRLESSRIIERLKRLDTGCGFGGGRNNLDVFYNSGLMLFKDINNLNLHQVAQAYIGSSCLTVANRLKYADEAAMGYSKPMLAQLSRSMEINLHHRMGSSFHSRTKREADTEMIMKRYSDPLHKACCRLGTLEDTPQNRDCNVRKKIVEKYMHHGSPCPSIYFDCCRAVYGEPHLRLSSLFPNGLEPRSKSRVVSPEQAPQYTDGQLLNIGQLERIEAQTLIRKDFRETWLFEVVKVEDSGGNTSLDVRLPHSITSWSLSAVALNHNRPMCILPRPLKIDTFQEVFIHIAMPYKIVQGEQIDLVATLFNYSPRPQDVLVYMYGVEHVCSDGEPGERSERRRLLVEKHSSQAVIFPMIPLKIGHYPIKLVAVTLSSNYSDIVERQLNVVPRGKPVTDETTFSLDPLNQQRRSKRAIQTGNLMDEIDSTRGLQHSKVKLTPSRESDNIVPQTQECIVSAIGDKLGQAVQTTMLDVENLIRLPHGCGEQVMIYLGPTLYTARYLSTMGKLSGDMRWRAIRYIQSGYKRILNFRKDNGAFSAFPRRNPSVWLTAFVAKMLCQTEKTPFIADEVHVDKTVIRSALSWLIASQNAETGTWIELNPVYHREMLGGVLRENGLTAFVTITLNECAHHSPDITDEEESTKVGLTTFAGDESHEQSNGSDKMKVATQKAEEALILDRYRALKEKNPYVLSLVAYSLSRSRPREAAAILNDLLTLAHRSQSKNQLFWRGDYSIETASYALQALIELAPIVASNSQSASSANSNWMPGADAVAIANWLSSRRSYSGAFESTQDTVVALEALSKFAQLQSTPTGSSLIPQSPQGTQNLVCNVTINNRTRRSIEFGNDNAQILQTFKLDPFDLDPISGETLDILTSGNGLGTMSIKLKYNVFQEEDELCRFNIDSSIEEWQPKIVLPSPDGPTEGVSLDGTKPAPGDSSSNDTVFEDSYFKTFDKSMLNELNLIDLNSREPSDAYQIQATQQNQRKPVEFLRLRRFTPPSDSSSVAKVNGDAESWTSKMVSSIRSKLPSWMTPKTTSTTTTARPYIGNVRFEQPEPTTINRMPDVSRRNSTSRRSTQSVQAPMVSLTSGIPADAHLNTLSKQIEITGQNRTTNSNVTTTQISNNPSRRLVLLLRVCAHHMSTRRDSEMAVIEVGILSGFKPNEADLKEILNDPGTPAMKYELSADRSLVVLYMDHIPHSGPYCFQFRLVRDSLVYNLQSGYIRVYEYYSPTHSCSNFYTPSRVSNLLETKCDSTGQVCQCATKSLCPATNKLLDLSEIHQVNATSASNQLVDLICSNRFDLVSMVKLKSVRFMEAGRIFKLSMKVKSDLKGNLTKIVEAQRQQRFQLLDSIRKPQHGLTELDGLSIPGGTSTSSDDLEDASLDYLHMTIDSSCVRDDPLLLHLAHPSQWKQGGELMILFARSNRLEKRYFRTAPKSSVVGRPTSPIGPRPKQNILSSKDSNWQLPESGSPSFNDAQHLQYSLTLPIDRDTILHDITYQAKVKPREAINNLILGLELRFRREKWTCQT